MRTYPALFTQVLVRVFSRWVYFHEPLGVFGCILVAKTIVVVFFTLTDRASTAPSNIIPGTWLPIRYVVYWTEKDQRNIYKAPTGDLYINTYDIYKYNIFLCNHFNVSQIAGVNASQNTTRPFLCTQERKPSRGVTMLLTDYRYT